MTTPEPPAAAVEAVLEKVLASKAFDSSPRLRRFLELVVRYSLAGDQDRIKEYTIGVEAFERGARFDPRRDAIVRVEALKLREKLLEYYRTEGATDVVTISIPKGTYRPIFHSHAQLPVAILDDPGTLCRHVESLTLQPSRDAVARARYILQCAISRWPNAAELQITLASAMLASIEMEFIAPRDGIPVLRRAARRALHLDPHLAEAHFYDALTSIGRRDKTAAISGARRASAAAPRSAIAHYWTASAYAADLRMHDMLAHMHLAVRLQPYTPFFQIWRAVALWWAGHASVAIRHLRDILTFEPNDPLASHWLGQICANTGRYDEARDAAARAYKLTGATQLLAGLGFVEALSGHTASAEFVLESLKQTAKTEFVADSRLAAIYVALKRLPSAAAALCRAKAEGNWELAWARGDRRWEPLRGRVPGI
jgi:Flp pilus assembly protein TadD